MVMHDQIVSSDLKRSIFSFISVENQIYRIIPNRSTECLDKSPGGGYNLENQVQM